LIQFGEKLFDAKFTAHNGEALASRQKFDALSAEEQNEVIEFLKSLQVLPAGSRALVVDEHGRPREIGD
jgi:hypothetical protein